MTSRRPVSEAFNQIEIGPEADVELRIDPARCRQQRDQHAKQQQQDQGPEKIRNGEKDADAAVDRPIRRVARENRRRPRRPPIPANGDQRRDQRKLERRRKPCQNQFEHVLMQADRTAEVAAEDLAKPGDELFRDRAIKSIERPQPVDIGRLTRPEESSWRSDRPGRCGAGRRRWPRRQPASAVSGRVV